MFRNIKNVLLLFKRIKSNLPTREVAFVLVILFFALALFEDSVPQDLYSSQPGFYKVTKVLDGDTIEVEKNGRKDKVRLVGIDTPETHHPEKPVQCFAVEATQFARAEIDKSNNNVKLVADSLGDNRDRYERLVRYVYLEDESLLNAKIIRKGYGFAYTVFPFSKSEEFVSFEKAAESQNLGLWSACELTDGFVKETVWP